MKREELANKFERYTEEISKYCKKQEECTSRCVFYDEMKGCILFQGAPDTWETHHIG